jgi:hypothetical protein
METKPPAESPAGQSPAAEPGLEDGDELRQTQTMRALAAAKSIDDISNSMAETLFGDDDLAKLNDALEASGWTDDDAAPPSPAVPAPTPPPAAKLSAPAPAGRPVPQPPAAKSAPPPPAPAPKPAPPPVDDDPFDFLGLGHDAPLELIDEPAAPQQRKEVGRNR